MAALNVLICNSSTQRGGLTKMKSSNGNGNSIVSSTPTASITITPTTTMSHAASATGTATAAAAAAASKQFSKITVQNVLSENNGNLLNISNNLNGNNTIVRKIKDFGMFGTVNASTGSAGNRSASSLTAGNAARKRPLASADNKSKTTHAGGEGKAPPNAAARKKPKASKESKKEAAKGSASASAAKALVKERVTDKVCIPRLKSIAADGTVKVPGTPGRKGLPLPLAVARRNARERNRVKQVNNGFAALRERIPEEVAETFESQASGRGAAKKLSKVETLRMAVEYIRSLERLLGFDFPIPGDLGDGSLGLLPGAACDDDSFTLIKDEFDALSPGMDDQFDDSLSNYDMDDYFSSNGAFEPPNNAGAANAPPPPPLTPQATPIDALPNITTLNGLQYIRIPGTNTYQLLTPDIFVGNSNSPPNSSAEEEQFSGLIDANCHSPSAGESSAAAADLHASPPLIMGMGTGTRSPAAMPSSLVADCTSSSSSSSLSRSPVLQTSSPLSSSSPNANTHAHANANANMLHLSHTAHGGTLAPAAANELLLRTCVIAAAASSPAIADALDGSRPFAAPTPLPHIDMLQQPRLIKQEFIETDFSAPSLHGALAAGALLYQTKLTTMQEDNDDSQQQQRQRQQQRQLLLDQHTVAVSPPLDHAATTTATATTKGVPTSMLLPNVAGEAIGLQAFYEHEQNANFYENVVGYKKELSDSMLETSSNCHSGHTPTLSDESMIDAIDWWEAHTPKSDGGSVIL